MIAFAIQLHIGDNTTTIADGYLSDQGIDIATRSERDLIASMVSLWAAQLADSSEAAE
jgi:hypothetical protein